MVRRSIPDQFEAIVARHASRIAVKSGGRALTYAELDAAASRLARAIVERGGAGSTVGLLLEPGVSLALGAIACLKAGIPYVPLELQQPPDRYARILADAEAALLVTDGPRPGLPPAVPPVLRLEEVPASSPMLRPAVTRPRTDLACVLYTSGSTGAPKGVMVSDAMILERVVRHNRFGIGPDDRLSALGAGGMNLFRALLTGAALVSLDVRTAGVGALPAWLRAERITLYHSVPTLFRHLAAVLGPDDAFPDLRIVNLTGEVLLDHDVESFRRHFPPGCVLVHGLGTTEAGTFHELRIDRATRIPGRLVPVGFSVEGTEVALLDPDGRPAPPGASGEIGVRSAHLATGYWKRPDLTAACFVPDPAGGGARVYRTGDLGRLLADGSLAHLGRNDAQVKVRGHRVEPGEVESVMLQHPAVREVAVVGRPAPEGMRLHAYVVTRDGSTLPVRDLRSFLRERLPEPMVPAVLVTLPALPLTPNGKVDRMALPEPGEAGEAAAGAVVPARDPVEACVVGVWRDVFGTSEVGVHHDFFALGGNSLQAMQMAARLEAALAVAVSMEILFDHPTVEELAMALRGLGAGSSA